MKEQIISRIKKLLKHAESAKNLGSLAEAEAFSLKANELLLEHNIQMMEVEEAEDTDMFKNMGWSERLSYKDNQSGNAWRIDLVGYLTKHNLCSFTYNRYFKYFEVYGKMENVEVVVWLYNFLSVGLLRLAQEHHVNLSPEEKKRYNRYAFLKDFLLGAVRGINYQLERQKQKMASEQMTALIVYNDKALDAFLKKEAPNVKTRNATKTKVVGEAYDVGLEVGQNYNINKTPLSQVKEKLQLN